LYETIFASISIHVDGSHWAAIWDIILVKVRVRVKVTVTVAETQIRVLPEKIIVIWLKRIL
jgi:hypothetical protein